MIDEAMTFRDALVAHTISSVTSALGNVYPLRVVIGKDDRIYAFGYFTSVNEIPAQGMVSFDWVTTDLSP